MKLTERKKEILKKVISIFEEKAGPVSSQNIAEGAGLLALSTATIRKEMAELEELGYLKHPHTSAGRIPSDKGYRFYVDNFIKKPLPGHQEKETNYPLIPLDAAGEMEMETILQRSSEQLARLTSYLSLIVAPVFYQSRFRHLEILKINQDTMLMVLITDEGRVYKRNFVVEGSYNSLDFQSTCQVLNSQLRDKSMGDISLNNIKLSEGNYYLVPLIKKILVLIKNCLEETLSYNRIFVHGTSSVINQPDFIDLKKIQKILGIIENEYLLMNLILKFTSEQEFIIKIGSEIFEEGPDDFSLVASRYSIYEHSTGTIGILGPKRMDYFRIINIINSFVKSLKAVFS